MEEIRKALWAMTEAEAAALAFLQKLEEAREAMREVIERRRNST